jgi:hydroxyethylthiazole kinase-like uncharacterized protein yjeF
MDDFRQWTYTDAARHIAVPVPDDDKYSRGVLGVITGSDRYPGAAVLGVEAALRTGVGMVRYLGGERVSTLVLQRRPEAVTADGRVQAWLIGSGTDAESADAQTLARVDAALEHALPTVLDGGALERVRDARGPVVLTPHHGELARLFDVDRATIARDAGAWAARAAEEYGVTVLLKGARTYIVGGGERIVVTGAPAWLATAGAGDALGGILGSLVATHSRDVAADPGQLARLAATAALVHGRAAERASAGGPLTILDLAASVSPTIAELLAAPGPAL